MTQGRASMIRVIGEVTAQLRTTPTIIARVHWMLAHALKKNSLTTWTVYVDYLFTVYVEIENADPLCSNIHDLLQRKKF